MKYLLKGRYEGRKEKKWGVRYSKLLCFSNREPHTMVAYNGDNYDAPGPMEMNFVSNTQRTL
jgi:hypothetical protein